MFMININFLCVGFVGLVSHVSGRVVELYKRRHKGRGGAREGGEEGGCVLSLFN